MGMVAPFLMAAGLGLSGQWAVAPEDADIGGLFGFLQAPVDGYIELASWLDLSNDPFWQEPLGLVFMIVVWSLVAAVFWLLMVVGWRRIYRNVPFLERDWSSIDQSFTLVVVGGVAWLLRGLFGFGEGVESALSFALLLSVYVPLFSAGLALFLPIVPGSGRIGGVLPNFLKIPFTSRFLMSDEQRDDAAAAQVTIKAATEATRQAEAEARAAKRAEKAARKKKR
jgi:hypothetical protein